MNIDLRAVLLVLAVALFALAGFGLVDDHPHFQLVPLGLALFALSFLPIDRRVSP